MALLKHVEILLRNLTLEIIRHCWWSSRLSCNLKIWPFAFGYLFGCTIIFLEGLLSIHHVHLTFLCPACTFVVINLSLGGVQIFKHAFSAQVVEDYNSNEEVHGILVQLPLPEHIDEKRILDAISLEKDVDGFHPFNIGSLALRGREPLFVSCTPKVISLSGLKLLCRHLCPIQLLASFPDLFSTGSTESQKWQRCVKICRKKAQILELSKEDQAYYGHLTCDRDSISYYF